MNHNLVTDQVEPNSFCSNPKRKILIYGSIGIVLIAIIVTIIVCLSLKENDKNENDNIVNDNGTGKGNPPESSNISSDDDEDDSFIEKEQPELDDETKRLIALYQKNSSEENFINLRKAVISNYNKVLVKKEKN